MEKSLGLLFYLKKERIIPISLFPFILELQSTGLKEKFVQN